MLDGFAQPDGTPSRELPTTRMVMTFEEIDGGARTTTTSHFDTLEALEQLLAMGMLEGMRLAMGQIDAVLADLKAFAADLETEAQLLSDTQVRICRVIRGSVEQVWRAHHEAALLQRWLLGPDGWTMPVCEVGIAGGEVYRYEWEDADGSNRFDFTGEVLDIQPPHRSMTTESMIGMEHTHPTNELTLTPVAEGTLLTLLITYPSLELRDMVLGTGMTGGMETSYARLEDLLA